MAMATIRQARPEDAAVCGQICYDAFLGITAAHNFPPYVPSKDVFVGSFSMMLSHPGFYCVAAEADGRIVGSNCMDERTPIAGIGPITVDPGTQNRGVGRALMRAVMKRAEERNFAGVRLVQAAYHSRSLSLYTTLGFVVREPLALMLGPAMGKGTGVRPATAGDVKGCNRVCWKVHGHDRGGELADAIQQGSATVVERDGRITGYSTGVKFFGHSVAETNPDLQALIAAVPDLEGPGFLVPTRNTELFRWCLANGLRVVEPMTLMSVGLYNEPAGAFLPSILF
jgi:GNAT superfamily N-acetyltransferase